MSPAVRRKTIQPIPNVDTRHLSVKDRWELLDLLRDSERDFGKLSAELETMTAQFESWRGRLAAFMADEQFLDILRLGEAIAGVSARLSAFAYLQFAGNTKDAHARSFKSKVEALLATVQNRMLFFDLWWQSLEASHAHRLREASGDFAYYLDSIRRFTRHTLSEPEEKVINLKNVTGRHTINTLYDVVTTGMTFRLRVNAKRQRILTREQLASYVRSPHPKIREQAYRELFRAFTVQKDLIGEMYSALIHDWKAENVDLRRYRLPIAARNLANDVPDEAVEALLAVCLNNAEVFQEYFRLKGRICKISPMTRYHLYAPHQAEQKRYRYPEAVDLVLNAYRAFSPRMADLAEQVLSARHVDVGSRQGKVGGAFCYSVLPGHIPYVLLNYTGEARDVATLAHELGHAIHGMMAAEHTIHTFHATLPLAETASVFGERILSDALMMGDNERTAKQALLLGQLDDIYATVMRQAYFVKFEEIAHDLLTEGATVSDLSESYLDLLRKQFGKAIRVPDEFRWEWLTIPHIFSSPFYCYAYSFGNLLVLGLYQQYKRFGSAFVPKYLELLAAGGSMSPEELLSKVDVDLRAQKFWQSGFDTIRGMVDDLASTLP